MTFRRVGVARSSTGSGMTVPPRWRAGARGPIALAVAVLAVSGALLTACGGPGKAAVAPNPNGQATTTTSTTAPPITTSTVVVGGKRIAVPTDSGKPITPLQDAGTNVVVTTGGFLPRTLYAPTKTPVVFTNLTPNAVTITFPHTPNRAAVIAPGASFTFMPDELALVYRSSTGDFGFLTVGVFTN
jgi:hypothetical protein